MLANVHNPPNESLYWAHSIVGSLLMNCSIPFTIFLIVEMDGSSCTAMKEDRNRQSWIKFGLIVPEGNVTSPNWGSLGRLFPWFCIFSDTKEIKPGNDAKICGGLLSMRRGWPHIIEDVFQR